MKKLISMLAICFAVVTASAASAVVPVGQTLTLTVTADGTQPFTYQWFRQAPPTAAAPNPVPIAIVGAITMPFVVGKVTTANAQAIAGTYTVVVSNAGGSTTSDTAVITILLPPSNAVIGASSS